MAVDTSFSSLFESLKVEEPWLPPKTWESIFSNRPSPSHALNSSPPQPQPTRSSLSEASLVRLSLHALQGVQSALITIEKLSAAFCSDPADRTHNGIPSLWSRSSTTRALGTLLISIGRLGSLVFLLRKLVDHFKGFSSDQSNCGLVNQAFAVAVGKVLEGYICALDTLYASVNLRHSSNCHDAADADADALHGGGLTSVVHTRVTLLEVYLHTKQLGTHIEALGNLCSLHHIALCFSVSPFEELVAKAILEFSNFHRAGDLLTYLYTQLLVADPAHHPLLKFLFLRSFEPYWGFIRSWIFKAEISDPYNEFIVHHVDDAPSYLHSKPDVPVELPLKQDGVAVPCFLKDFFIPIIRAGQQLQVLMKLFQLCHYVGPSCHTYEDFLPSWSGYLNDHFFGASTITFGKKYLESMVNARNSYYRTMQEKVEAVFMKMEFRYQQVLPLEALPICLENGGRHLDAAAVLKPDGRIDDEKDSDYSCTKGELYLSDASQLSECSSVSGSEEQTEEDQVIKLPISLGVPEERYLSSLKFFMSSSSDDKPQHPVQSERLHDVQSCLLETCETIDTPGLFSHSCHRKTALGPVFTRFGLEEPNSLSVSNTLCRDDSNRKSWSLGIQSYGFCDNEGHGYDPRFHQFDFSLRVRKPNVDLLQEYAKIFSNMTSTHDVFSEKALDEDQLDNGTFISNFFTLQPQTLKCHRNILSTNPMLRRNASFHLMKGSGEKWHPADGLSLPCFHFSTVEDPCKLYEEKLAASLRYEFESMVPSRTTTFTTTGKNHDKGKQCCAEDDLLIDNGGTSSTQTPLDLKKHDKEAVVSTSGHGGSNWETQLGSFCFPENDNVGDIRGSLLAMFEIPLDFIINKFLLQEILLQYKYVSNLTIKLLEEGFELQEHLLALRRYYFMELADWADLFIMSLWRHKWFVTEADKKVSEIQGFLESSLQRSSCERDPYKDRLFVYIRGNGLLPLSTSGIGVDSFTFLGLGYQVDWPVSIVLTPRALSIYSEIFSFLLKVKLAAFSFTDMWCSLKDMKDLISQNCHSVEHEQQVSHFKMLTKMRHQLNHFISTLQQYMQSQLSHVSWCRFHHSLKYEVRDMMDLESVHMAYLSDSLHICFLSDETRHIASIIESILECALDFHSCIIGSMWNVGMDQADLHGKLSRICIPQVLTIRQKFVKNLRELHLHSLKSPKHGDFGLSRFWGYLNYNEYYSDVGARKSLSYIR